MSPLCYEHNVCTQFAQQLKPSKGPTIIRQEDEPIHKRVIVAILDIKMMTMIKAFDQHHQRQAEQITGATPYHLATKTDKNAELEGHVELVEMIEPERQLVQARIRFLISKSSSLAKLPDCPGLVAPVGASCRRDSAYSVNLSGRPTRQCRRIDIG